MRNVPHPPSRNPFATLAALTASAITGPLLPSWHDQVSGAGSTARPGRRVSLSDRLDHWLGRARQGELERSLASSGDVAERKDRIRDRQVGVLHRYY